MRIKRPKRLSNLISFCDLHHIPIDMEKTFGTLNLQTADGVGYLWEIFKIKKGAARTVLSKEQKRQVNL